MVKDLREAVQQDNHDRMKSLTSELQQAMMQIDSSMYADSNGASNGNSANAGAAPDSDGDEVIDADFVSQ